MENKDQQKGKKKGGRPPKLVKRDVHVGFYVTVPEMTAIAEKAEITGLRFADYLRQSAINGKVRAKPTAEELKAYRDLTGIANNLNQLARAANREGLAAAGTKIVRALTEVNNLIESLK